MQCVTLYVMFVSVTAVNRRQGWIGGVVGFGSVGGGGDFFLHSVRGSH